MGVKAQYTVPYHKHHSVRTSLLKSLDTAAFMLGYSGLLLVCGGKVGTKYCYVKADCFPPAFRLAHRDISRYVT